MAESGVSPLIIKYEKQLEEDPRSRAFAPLAEAYRRVGLIENAFTVLKKGLRYNPDYLLGYLTLAQCYMDKGEYSLCYTTLRPLASQNRDNIKLQKLFGESAILTDNKEDALDTFKYLLFLQPKDQEIAQKVSVLENELQEEPVYSPPEDIKFNVEELSPSPTLDRSLDDWVQVDLSSGSEDDEDGADEEKDTEEDSWSVESLEVSEEPESEIEEKATPVMTHTLVDLYIQQGHKDKAIELLRKIHEIQPENETTRLRLEELESSLESEAPDNGSDDESSSEDEGHQNLMAAFDNVKPQEDTPVPGLKVAEVLDDFAEVLRQRSRDHLRT